VSLISQNTQFISRLKRGWAGNEEIDREAAKGSDMKCLLCLYITHVWTTFLFRSVLFLCTGYEALGRLLFECEIKWIIWEKKTQFWSRTSMDESRWVPEGSLWPQFFMPKHAPSFDLWNILSHYPLLCLFFSPSTPPEKKSFIFRCFYVRWCVCVWGDDRKKNSCHQSRVILEHFRRWR
jgi:hypothetical protein